MATLLVTVATLLTLLCVFYNQGVWTCGVTTHIEIGHRALNHFQTDSGKLNVDYEQLLRKHQDAFQAGNPYPDAYYDNVCFSGKYHSVSEDTHWAPFMNATINYIRNHYPPPWDEATEKLVVFLFGFVSHQVADVPWHSLGIDQGFLTTMGNINFHGSFGTAHPIGDFGGDVLSQYELTLPYIGEVGEWYVPVVDLEQIYLEFYGEKRIPMHVIVGCNMLMYLSRLGEDLAVAELFAYYAHKSPYLVDRLEDYFLGGLDDMAAQTQNVWQDVAYMIEHGTGACSIPHNPLYINCKQKRQVRDMGKAVKNGYYIRPYLSGVNKESIIVRETKRGIYLRPSRQYLNLRNKRRQNQIAIKERIKLIDVEATYSFSQSYSKLGWSLTSGDMNNDGNNDLVMGSPGWGSTRSIQQGRVYVVYGDKSGLPRNITGKVVTVDGAWKGQSKFGSSVAVLDVNLDGISDLAVGAPSFSEDGSHIDYKGMVYIYYGTDSGRFSEPNITISCLDRYCNLGWTLSAGDLNGDGHKDLLIGSPYANRGGEQRGVVFGLYSSSKYHSSDVIKLTTGKLDWTMAGDQDYGWFGGSIEIKFPWIVITQPVYRICAEKNCSYSQDDKQSCGKIYILKASSEGPVLVQTLTGQEEFSQFGASVSIGQPYDNKTYVLAVAAVTANVSGQIYGGRDIFNQAGKIYLYNLTSVSSVRHSKLLSPFVTFSGNRRFGRFGADLLFSDLTGSGYDDFIVTSPLYSKDISDLLPNEAEEGRVFVFSGGDKFPRSNLTVSCHGDISPCPEEQAGLVLSFNNNEKKARFGRRVAVVKSRDKVSLAIGAPHSSFQSVYMQGAVGVCSI